MKVAKKMFADNRTFEIKITACVFRFFLLKLVVITSTYTK